MTGPSFLTEFALFPFWWFSTVPLFFLKFCRKLMVYLDQRWAATLMARQLFVPLFGDATFLGRIIAVVFRLGRFIIGGFFILGADLFLLIFLAFWLAFPFILAVHLNLGKAAAFFLLASFFKAVLRVFYLFYKGRKRQAGNREILWRLEAGGNRAGAADDQAAVAEWLRKKWEWEHPPHLWEERFVLGPLGGVNRAWTGRATPVLDSYSLDLTAQARKGRLSPLIERPAILSQLLRVLEKERANNAILVGVAGCGKTTIAFSLAKEIIRGSSSPALSGKRFVSLEIGALVAGTRSDGELQERIQQVMGETESSGSILLFVDEVQNVLLGGGGVDTSLIFAALEPHLTAGRFQMVGATSWENYRKYIEPNEAFARLFETVEVPETNLTETLAVLQLASFSLEKKYRLTISYPALKRIVELSSRFRHDRAFPDKALGLLEESVVFSSKREEPGSLLTAENVSRLFSEKMKIPLSAIEPNEAKQLLELEKRMHRRLINQEEAISAIANAVRRSRVGLRDPQRPIVSLLFVGPTGVGKTEAAKTLAEVYFGQEKALTSFDMSDYQREDSVSVLRGSPPGPERAAEPGLLTEKVRQNPFSLLLFDEIEKAHPRILDLFLQVLEEGRLTETTGRLVSFSETILIFTSNAGAELIYQSLRDENSLAKIKEDIFAFLQKYFRVELLNRFDGIVVFSPLSHEQIGQIVRRKLNIVQRKLAEKGVRIEFEEGLIEKLAEEGYDPALGARPLRRLIQDKIESSLARRLLSGELKDGSLLTLGPDFF